MLKKYNYEAKTEPEVLEKASNELAIEQEDMIYEISFQEGKLFKSSKYQIEVIKKEDIKNYLKEYCEQLGQLMNIPIHCEIVFIDTTISVNLDSENNALLIGKDGRNLNSIQIILRQLIKNEIGNQLKLNVDIGNYKEKKLKNLELQVKKIAQEVLETEIEVALDPMNSYERRFVHSVIAEIEGVITESIGEGVERHIVIKKA